MPIGEDDFGNLTCLKVGGEDYGAVYIWDHEEVGAEAYARVTDSSTEFFRRLRAKPDST